MLCHWPMHPDPAQHVPRMAVPVNVLCHAGLLLVDWRAGPPTSLVALSQERQYIC